MVFETNYNNIIIAMIDKPSKPVWCKKYNMTESILISGSEYQI